MGNFDNNKPDNGTDNINKSENRNSSNSNIINNKRRFISLFLFFIIVTVLTFLDQITKILSDIYLKNQKPVSVIEGVFELHYLENTGMAWGMLSGARPIFILLTVIVFLIIIYIIYKMPLTKKYIPAFIVLNLIGAGAIGNFIDRLFLGYVRDFLYFKLIDFPVFNVADCYITIGIIIFAILILFIYDEKDFSFLKFKKNE